MRIVCQKCSAAYAIDDKHVTPKGVRAQCPRCRHMQLVKKEEAPAGAAPPAPAAAPPVSLTPAQAPAGSGLHFGQTSPAPGAAPSAASPFSFDFAPPPFPGGAPPAPAPAAPAGRDSSPFDFGATGPGASNPFDFGSPPPGAPAAAAPASPFDFGGPAPAAAASASPFDFGAPPPSAPKPAAPASPFDFSAPGPSAPGPAAPGSPFDFGAPPPPAPKPAAPASPFDFGPPPPAAAAAAGGALDDLLGAPPASASQVSGVKCRTCGKEITDPFDQALGVCDDCRAKAVAEPSTAEPRPAAPPSAAAASAQAPAPAGSGQGTGDVSQVRNFMRPGSPGGKGRVIGLAVGALVVVGAGVGLLVKRPWQTKGPTLVTKTDKSGRPVDGIIQQWKLKYPDIDDANARALVDEGEELLAKDTTAAYRDAEEAFEQALVLEPSNDRALAGWALSLAFGRPGQIDDVSAKAAEAMLTGAEQRGGDARIFVAHAHFLIARNANPNDIKVLAERGLASKQTGDRALAALAVGQTLLTKNPELADKSFKEALQLDPKLKRAYFFAAQLAATQGRYKDANDALEKRLELDADQWEAAEALAKLAVDVGEAGRARRVLEAAKESSPRSGRPRLTLGVLAYQHLNDLPGATELLTALVNDAEATRADRSDALVHLAAIQRMQGDAAKASDSIDQALELAPDSTAAKLQRWLVLLERGVASSARLELDGLKGKLGDKQLEAVLEGRMQVAEGRFAEAMETLGAVSEADPRRVEATLLAGAAAARARKDGKAWEFCLKKALKADPFSRAVPPLTHHFVRPADLLKPAVNAYAAMVADLNEDPSPTLCEGAVAWFSEDYATADKHFSKVLSIDPKNAEAYAYRAFIALRKRDLNGGLKLAGKAIDSSRTSALGYLAQAQAQMLLNKPDLAKVSAATALKHGPALVAPKVLMADVEASRKQPEEARRLLTSVLLADPLYRDAKRVLYKHAL